MGNTYLFAYYRTALAAIAREGLPAYLRRVGSPYVRGAARHFSPRTDTFTQRLLRRYRDRKAAPKDKIALDA
jgi:hypothetical protein